MDHSSRKKTHRLWNAAKSNIGTCHLELATPGTIEIYGSLFSLKQVLYRPFCLLREHAHNCQVGGA